MNFIFLILLPMHSIACRGETLTNMKVPSFPNTMQFLLPSSVEDWVTSFCVSMML
jgi:hypothetical protein